MNLPSLQRSVVSLESRANSALLPLSETKGNVQMEGWDCTLFLQHIVKTMNKTMQEHLLSRNTTWGLKPWPDCGSAAQPAHSVITARNARCPQRQGKPEATAVLAPKEALSSFRKSNISWSTCRSNGESHHPHACWVRHQHPNTLRRTNGNIPARLKRKQDGTPSFQRPQRAPGSAIAFLSRTILAF